MNPALNARLISAACLASILVLPAVAAAQAGASEGREASQSRDTKAKSERKRRANAPVVLPGGSGESRAERSARLRRECKGRPNAGACTGYTD